MTALSAALHAWQYNLLLEVKSEHASCRDGLDGFKRIIIDDRPAEVLVSPTGEQLRREISGSTQPNESHGLVDCEEALEEAKGEILQLRNGLSVMKQKAWDMSVRTSLWDTEVSRHASMLLAERYYSDRARGIVDEEIRNSLSGMALSDEEILWMGDCAESGDWPELDGYGEKNIFLSLAQKLGPERLAREVGMHALHSLLRETPEEDASRIWGEHLKTAYLRLPSLGRASLRSKFPGEFDNVGH